MATRIESEYPLSPTNDESDGDEGQEEPVDDNFEEEKYDVKTNNNGFADILKRLESAGALLKKPKKEYRCITCDEDFVDWEDLENHLYQHVSLPSVVLDKLPSDEEDTAGSGDENWSDDEEPLQPLKQEAKKTPQKVDINQILKKTGITIKMADTDKSSDAALNRLSNLGFTIKKNSTPIKKEKIEEPEQQSGGDITKNLGKIKIKLKSDGTKTNTFQVINGLKDFKPSDDENDESEHEDGRHNDDSEEDDEIKIKNQEEEEDDFDPDSDEEQYVNNSRRSSENSESAKNNLQNLTNKFQGKIKIEPMKTKKNAGPASKTIVKEIPAKIPIKLDIPKEPFKEIPKKATPLAKPLRRPSVKQTPKRDLNNPLPVKVQEIQQEIKKSPSPIKEVVNRTPERRESHDANPDNVVVKKEIQDSTNTDTESKNLPLFTQQIKSERSSPPPLDRATTPIIARIKTEPEISSNAAYTANSSLLPVTKKEDSNITIIEINGDSNDEDDDCCVVSSTPAPDVKPLVPKTEAPIPLPPSSYPTSMSYPAASQTSYTGAPVLSSRLSSMPSMEKQHNFNWNAPDTKPPIDMLEKSADDIFESLLSSSTKKENMSSLSDVSEYISLDTLGPKHSCEICNTIFTDISLLEEHKRMTGHSNSLVAPSSSTLLPYSSTSNILSSLLPGKLAEQVGKLSTIGNSGPGFTHQQNVMINIQAYPGAGGVMPPPQPYNSYPPGHNQHGGYPQPPNNMYSSSPGQPMPGQYPGSTYPQSGGFGQYPPPMSKPGYPGTMPPNVYSSASSPYSTPSPLQSMQQSVYGQSSTTMMNQQPVTMGPPGSSPSQGYTSASSPNTMKQSSNIRIQNVQTFPPGQLGQPINQNQTITSGQQVASNQQPMHVQEMPPGQTMQGQITTPTQIRMAVGASNPSIPRTRMPSIRGARQQLRPGMHLQGQMRGAVNKGPRMPLKRPGAVVGGPVQKRRPDMLIPGKHDNEDCQVMSMQKQRDGLPLIQSVQGARDKLNLGSQISITKKTVNKEANAMANVLASRGISVKQKQKSRSPSPQRSLPNIPNLGAGMSIKHSSRSSNFSIPEAKIGGGMLTCKICKKMFMSSSSLTVHMSAAHPQTKIPLFKCDECPASYPKSLQLQHHKRVFHNVTGPDRELGLPVVDLSQEDNLQRLSNLGIYSFIPLANREQGNGCFGIPVISVHNVQNGLTSGLQALGADGLLSLGPLKPLPNS